MNGVQICEYVDGEKQCRTLSEGLNGWFVSSICWGTSATYKMLPRAMRMHVVHDQNRHTPSPFSSFVTAEAMQEPDCFCVKDFKDNKACVPDDCDAGRRVPLMQELIAQQQQAN